MKQLFPNVLICAAVFFMPSLSLANEVADSIFINGKIWTGDSSKPSAEALALKGNKILAVGSTAEILKLKTASTKSFDLQGKLVTPGFIDNHTHFSDTSGLISAVQVRDASSKEEFVNRIADYAKTMESGKWMLYGIWDHEAWGGQLPEAKWIDKVTAETPVYLWRTDGHMALANSAAMKLAGINDRTPDVEGGEIVRDRDGKPTGVFKDAAMDLIIKVIPPVSNDEQAALFKIGINHAISYGVTQIHNMGLWTDLKAFQTIRDRDQLKMRIYSFVPIQSHTKLAEYVAKHGRGDDMHRWGGLKAMVDGSLGSTTAWFYEAYNDEPDKFGFPLSMI